MLGFVTWVGGASAQAGRTESRQVSETISIFMERGQTQRVWFFYGFDDACALVRGFNVTIDRLPRHGQAWVQRSERVIGPDWLNFRSSARDREKVLRCAGRSMPLLEVHYRAKPDTATFDDMSFVTTSRTGRYRRFVEVKIAVR
jgi:hypothetical protein